jgi:ketosteroid isomerase-like protein
MKIETSDLREEAVLSAANRLIDAFSLHDTQAYFEAFAPHASFVFHSHVEVLPTREHYERLWATWECELGFRVLSCQSSEQTVQMLGDTAVFTHQVRTTLRTHEGESILDERETIVFALTQDGKWLAVHEHLSPVFERTPETSA